MITGDVPRNVESYADVLGLRLVEKTQHLRTQLERHLTPPANPRRAQHAGARP